MFSNVCHVSKHCPKGKVYVACEVLPVRCLLLLVTVPLQRLCINTEVQNCSLFTGASEEDIDYRECHVSCYFYENTAEIL